MSEPQLALVATKEKTERDFLHDLSTPLATLYFSLDALNDTTAESGPTAPNYQLLLKRALDAMEKLKTIVQERKAYLVDKSGG